MSTVQTGAIGTVMVLGSGASLVELNTALIPIATFALYYDNHNQNRFKRTFPFLTLL